jgi:hypothetical protein
MMRQAGIICLLWCISQWAAAQTNILAGYKNIWIGSDRLNGYVNDYNLVRPESESELGKIQMLHGLGIGLRQSWKYVRIEAQYGLCLNQSRTKTVNTTGSKIAATTWSMSHQSLTAGLELHIAMLGIGTQVGYARFQSKLGTGQIAEPRLILNQDRLSAMVFLSFEIPSSSRLSMSIRPYLQFSQTAYDIYPIANKLAPATHSDPSLGNYGFGKPMPGIMILLCNGSQPD